MSYSVDPPQLLGVAERLRGCFDDLDEVVTSLRRGVDAVAQALTRATPARTGFLEVSDGRVDLAHRIVGRGRSAVAALQSAVLAYLAADLDMAMSTQKRAAAVEIGGGNPFDPTLFGKRRL